MQVWEVMVVAGAGVAAVVLGGLIRRGRSFRERLFRWLLVAALVPTLLVSGLAGWGYSQAIDLLQAPGLLQPTEGGLVLTRHLLGGLESAAEESLRGWSRNLREDPARADSADVPGRGRVWVVGVSDGELLWPANRSQAETFASISTSWPEPEDLPWSGWDGGQQVLAARAVEWGGRPAVAWWVHELPQDVAEAVQAVQQGSRGLHQLQLYYGSLVRQQGLVVAALALVLLTLASLWLSRHLADRLARPLAELSDATRRVAAGERDIVFPDLAEDEVGALQRSFVEMAAALERSEGELRRSERLAAWRQVARRLAHEIKNPLTPIHLAVHRLRSRVEGEELEEGLDVILEETARLQRLAEDFSTFARLSTPRPRPVEFAELLEHSRKLYAPDRRLVGEAIDREIQVRADAGQLGQVLANLLRNAVEASPQGSDLHIRWSLEDEFFVFEVEDEGPGLPPEGDRVFEVDFTTKSFGTGLGLPICRRIAEDHGGRVEAVRGRGSGACFRLRWPRAMETIE